MAKRQLWSVHTPGRAAHLSDTDVMREVSECERDSRKIISDAAAQTIASWWHSPAEPLTTGLSTAGNVDRYLTLEMFFDESSDPTTAAAHWVGSAQQRCLAALGAYIKHHQETAPSGARACACYDCLDTVYGVAGELCNACTEHGCDAQFTSSCERPDAYAEDEGDPCDGADDCTCIFCIPGC